MTIREGELPKKEITMDTEYWVDLKVDEYVLTPTQAKDPTVQSLFHGRLPVGKPEKKEKSIVMRFVSHADTEDYRRIKKFGKTRGMERLRERLFGHAFKPSVKKRMAFAEKLLIDQTSPTRVKIKAAKDLVEAEKKGLYQPKSVSLSTEEKGQIKVTFLNGAKKALADLNHRIPLLILDPDNKMQHLQSQHQ